MFDTAQMNTVLEYADVFYNKRYLLEKEVRINELLGIEDDIIDVVDVEEPIEVVDKVDEAMEADKEV